MFKVFNLVPELEVSLVVLVIEKLDVQHVD